MMRVTVELRWEEDENGDPRIELTEIMGASWHGKFLLEEWEKRNLKKEEEGEENETMLPDLVEDFSGNESENSDQ